jgi:class 3 adenylate cyclase
MAISRAAGLNGNREAIAPALSMKAACIQCALERLAGRNYCGTCGKQLRPRCERRQVTVLFADVSGFTALSERLDPEQVGEIMDRTFEVMLEAVHEHDGTVNQFLGDGVMALFGDEPGEHHASRALSAALAVRERLESVRSEVRRSYGVDFRVRMSINTGPVVVGTIGAALRTDYTATGHTTSVASQLLRVAAPGQIVLTGRSVEHASRRYEFEELGDVRMTESLETVEVYALTHETTEYVESQLLAAV